MRQQAQVKGYIRAVAEQSHPLQTNLALIITDFEPNRNKQGIPLSEAENILRFAPNTPLKINFDGELYSGHTGARPIGPITQVYMAEDNGRQVIAGNAVIWNDLNEDVSEHLKSAFAEGVGTSWEIYYEDSEVDDSGTEWLKGCIFAGTCIVETPAYGPTRTRLLAIAEALNQESRLMAQENTNDVEATDQAANVEEENVAEAATTNDVETLRTDLSSALNSLSMIYEGLYQMLDKSYEIESQLATTDLAAVAEQFTKLVAGIQKRFDSLQTKATTAETALSELQTQIAQAQAAKTLEDRTAALASVGISIDERKDFYLSLSEENFVIIVEDFRKVKGLNRADSSAKVVVPDAPLNGSSNFSIKDLAILLK